MSDEKRMALRGRAGRLIVAYHAAEDAMRAAISRACNNDNAEFATEDERSAHHWGSRTPWLVATRDLQDFVRSVHDVPAGERPRGNLSVAACGHLLTVAPDARSEWLGIVRVGALVTLDDAAKGINSIDTPAATRKTPTPNHQGRR